MAADAVGHGLDERGPAAGARARERLADHSPHFEEIIAIHHDTAHAVRLPLMANDADAVWREVGTEIAH